jgi:hypothetical protein
LSKVLTAALGAAVALAVAGCGSQGGDSGHAASSQAHASPSASARSTASSSKGTQNAKAAKAIARSFMTSTGSGGGDQLLDLDHKAARCIGVGVVQKLGIRKLEKYGVLSEHLKGKGSVDSVRLLPADAKATTAVLFKCSDVAGMIWKAVDKDGQIPLRVRPCVKKALDEDNLRPVFVQYFEGHEKLAQKSLVRPIMACAHGAAG